MDNVEGLKMKYFVLNPHKDNTYGEASRAAIYEYADKMEPENSELASELRVWVGSIDFKLAKVEADKKAEQRKKCKVWNCKIVVPIESDLPDGFDAPPRRVAIEAVEGVGAEVLGCFSGWGGKLTDIEVRVLEGEGDC